MFFENCETNEKIKAEYKRLVKLLHPDNGGSEEVFKEMQNEFDIVFNQVKNYHTNKENKKYYKETEEAPEAFRSIIAELERFKNINIDLVGEWLWVSGSTKDIKEELKKIGFRWSHDKGCWYYHTGAYRRHSNKNLKTLEELKNWYGCEAIKHQKKIA